jgi:hypothetical protein
MQAREMLVSVVDAIPERMEPVVLLVMLSQEYGKPLPEKSIKDLRVEVPNDLDELDRASWEHHSRFHRTG